MATTGNAVQASNNSGVSGNDTTVYLGRASLAARSGNIELLLAAYCCLGSGKPTLHRNIRGLPSRIIVIARYYYQSCEIALNYHNIMLMSQLS